jgi:uncharacterized protein (TIGR01777 family)
MGALREPKMADLPSQSARGGGTLPRCVAISGASGLIGAALVRRLASEEVQVRALVRRAPQAGSGEVQWDPARGVLDARALSGVDAVVHLAGENVGAGRWTAARKAAIRASRVDGTRLVAETVAKLQPRPRVLVCASAVGFYGDRGEEVLTEASAAGRGVLADVCQAWEAATEPARAAGIRVVNLRVGMVLARDGGALARMLPVFRKGAGGPVGDGRQYMSWITLVDLVRVITHVLADETVHGPVNAVTPEAVTNERFSHVLAALLGRPALLRVPAVAVKLMFGEMGRELLLASTRAVPGRLTASGFRFEYPELAAALRAVLAAAE